MFTSLALFASTLYPLAWLPAEWDNGTTDPFAALLAEGGQPDLTHLLVAQPFDPEGDGESIGLPPPLTFLPLAWGPEFAFSGITEPVHLADRTYLSQAADSPASKPFKAVLAPAYALSASLGSSDDPIGDAEVSLGDVTIRNGSGELDALCNYAWGGRLLEILAGKDEWPLSDFATILRGTVVGLRFNEAEIHLTPALRTALFDQLVTRNYYAGTGDGEGPAELAGVPKPLALGRCRQLPLRQVNAGLQIWQAAEVVDDFLAVRDIGLEVTDSTDDFATYALLAAATVDPGEFATCNAEGLVRFGSDVTVPTCDVDGDPAAGTTAPEIIEWLVTTRLPVGAVLSATEVEGGSFNAVGAARGWSVGLFIDDEIEVRDAIRQLTRSIGAFAAPTRDGMLALGLFSTPETPTATLTEAEVDDAGPELAGLLRPVGKVTVGYAPNWRVMTDAEISETVGADRENFRQRFRTVSASASLQQRDAVDYRIDTTLDDAGDAGDLADVLIALLSRCTQRYRVPLRVTSLPYWIGDRVRFEYPRFGLAAGVDYLVAGIDESSDGERALVLWGAPPNIA